MKQSIFFVVLLLVQSVLMAQVLVMPEKKQIAPGEPLPVGIRIFSSKPTQPQLKDTLGSFEILRREKASQQQTDTGSLFSQTIIITSFDSGRLLLPAIKAEDGSVKTSKPDTILVQRIPPDSLKGYTDIRNYFPGEESNLNSMMQWLLLLAVIVSGIALFLLVRRKNSNPLPDEASITSKETWQKEWQHLQQQWQKEKLSHEQAAEFVMILSRALFALQGLPTSSKTGAELVRTAQKQWAPEQWQPFKTVVSHCYSILFAKQQPGRQTVAEQIEYLGTIANTVFQNNSAHTNA